MNWHSAAEFFHMGGYALFVWGSVLACAVSIGGELVGVRLRRRQALGRLRDEVGDPADDDGADA